jgi:chromate transporter
MMLIFAGAPFIEQLRSNPRLSGALQAVTAAVVGVILNLTLWFAWHVLLPGGGVDWSAAGLTALAAVLMLGLHRGLVETVAVMALLGILVRFLL